MSVETMASTATSTVHALATTSPDAEVWEKQFFTTWLRLMERLRDVTEISQALHSVLKQSGDGITKLQDAQHKANLLSATDKTLTGLVTRINEYFFWDIVPALKRARQVNKASSQHAQDSLDRYLELGDEEGTMPQAFVDNMSGWGAAPQAKGSNKSHKSKKVENDDAIESESDTDDDIQADKLQYMLVANGLKLTATRARDFSIQCVPQQQSNLALGLTENHAFESYQAQPMKIKDKAKTTNESGNRPSSTETDFSSRSLSGADGPTPFTQSRNSIEDVQLNDRIDKRTAANLVAEEVLGVRTFKSAKEFLIRWKGVKKPLWITRRKASPQATKIIDLCAVKSQTRDRNVLHKSQTQRTSPKGKKKEVRDGFRSYQGHQVETSEASAKHQEAVFYSVDHIVSHREFNNSRQYLVRWENYDESEDTWEYARKLRVDVPDIVDAYEKQLRRDQTQSEESQSAICGFMRDVRTELTKKKRGSKKTDLDRCRGQLIANPLQKKRRLLTVTKEVPVARMDNSSEDDLDEVLSDDNLLR